LSQFFSKRRWLVGYGAVGAVNNAVVLAAPQPTLLLPEFFPDGLHLETQGNILLVFIFVG